MTAPDWYRGLSGTVTVSATASDNVGVVGVQFFLDLDSAALGAEDTTSPYSVSWADEHGQQRQPRPLRAPETP